jgi:hypothetical protein
MRLGLEFEKRCKWRGCYSNNLSNPQIVRPQDPRYPYWRCESCGCVSLPVDLVDLALLPPQGPPPGFAAETLRFPPRD